MNWRIEYREGSVWKWCCNIEDNADGDYAHSIWQDMVRVSPHSQLRVISEEARVEEYYRASCKRGRIPEECKV